MIYRNRPIFTDPQKIELATDELQQKPTTKNLHLSELA